MRTRSQQSLEPTNRASSKPGAIHFERSGLTKDDKEGRRILFNSFFPDRDAGAAPTADETDYVISQLEQVAATADDDSVLVALAEEVIGSHVQSEAR